MALLSAGDQEDFRRDGVLILRGFYDLEEEIVPIQRAIFRIIGLVADANGIATSSHLFAPACFDAGYAALITTDRALGGVVYDAVKQVPAFVRLVASARHVALVEELRKPALPGIAGGGYGIRIDNPGEDRFRAPWHQDYTAQFRSADGIVLWSPLVEMTEEMGPVEFCVGSHRAGPIRVHTHDAEAPDKTGAYALRLEDEDTIVTRYPHVAPLTRPGDLVLIDYLTIHRSGRNRGERSRWSMQMRYFNFLEPTGVARRWAGGFAAGYRLEQAAPELVVPPMPKRDLP